MSESDITEEEQRNAIITTITLDISSKHLKEVPKTIKNFSNIEVRIILFCKERKHAERIAYL